jgi:hypothetical protein
MLKRQRLLQSCHAYLPKKRSIHDAVQGEAAADAAALSRVFFVSEA